MGQEDERDRRLRDLAGYQVNARLLRRPRPVTSCCTACPPTAARRSRRTCCGARSSAAWDEAENRLHAQKALLAMIVE